MPIYEYHCPVCDKRFEKFQSFSASKTCPCPYCGAQASRVISLASFVLKGTGWYVTDHPSKERQKAMAKAKKENTPSTTSSSSTSSTSKKNS